MGLITQTQEAYYNKTQTFTGSTASVVDGSNKVFDLLTSSFSVLPTSITDFVITINGQSISSANYGYSSPTITFSGNTNNTDVLESDGAPKTGFEVIVTETNKAQRHGQYRYISLADIVNNYMIAFVGEGKLIPTCKRTDVLFHAKRGIQEFSYDITRVEKIQEVEVADTLSVPFPQDYVNYVRLSRVDDAGIEHIIYPARYTSQPSESILQNEDHKYLFDSNGNLLTITPYTSDQFKNFEHANLAGAFDNADLTYDVHKDIDRIGEFGARYGSDPEISQKNGIFTIDELNGSFHFSNELLNKIITIKYISDGLGTDDEMQIHKLAEDAIYKYITYAIGSSRINFPEFIINRFRKEKRAAMRNAKLRLSNLKLGELTQVMRGKSKHIKH
tara:strand:+ start:4202 stop:5368 length:1167 start_codon:yes stop_codon:yes gene_type:complete